jgi:hypothetical protein
MIVGFDVPEEYGAPLRLQANIAGSSGTKLLEIVDNEWRVRTSSYDVITTANRLEIREQPGRVAFEMEFTSDKGLDINTLDMSFRDCSVTIRDGMVSAKRGGTINSTLGRVTADIGIHFPADGGVVLGRSPPPFFQHQVEDFAPQNEIERALAESRNGRAQWERFRAALRAAEVFVLRRAARQVGGAFEAELLSVGNADPALVILTAPNRIGPYAERVQTFAVPEAIPFGQVQEGFRLTPEIWINPGSRVTMRLPWRAFA